MRAVRTAIQNYNAHAYGNLLLNKILLLALAAYLKNPLERDPLETICNYKLTPSLVTMLMTLCHPKECGAK